MIWWEKHWIFIRKRGVLDVCCQIMSIVLFFKKMINQLDNHCEYIHIYKCMNKKTQKDAHQTDTNGNLGEIWDKR